MRSKNALVEVVETDKMIDFVKFREAEPELFDELAADYPGTKSNYLFCVGEEYEDSVKELSESEYCQN